MFSENKIENFDAATKSRSIIFNEEGRSCVKNLFIYKVFVLEYIKCVFI